MNAGFIGGDLDRLHVAGLQCAASWIADVVFLIVDKGAEADAEDERCENCAADAMWIVSVRARQPGTDVADILDKPMLGQGEHIFCIVLHR